MQVIVSQRSGKEIVLLFPITSREPHAGMQALLLPDTETRRAGLRNPAWIVVDEWNEEEDLQNSVSVADFQQIREAAINAIRTRRYRSIRR